MIRRLAATQPADDEQAARLQAGGAPRDEAAAGGLGLAVEHARHQHHGLAVADTVYSVAEREPVVDADRATEEAEMEAELNRACTHSLLACWP